MRNKWLAGFMICLMAVMMFAGIPSYAKNAEDKIAVGIYLGDVSVSGMTKEEAIIAVNDHIASKGEETVLFTIDGEPLEVSRGSLGIAWNNPEVVEEAMAVGKTGNIVKKYKENEVVVNSIASHHGATEAKSVIANLVQIADSLSASRPGARNDSLENYIKRLEQLENVSNDIKGVEKSYALQAGRELRVLVKPEEISDIEIHKTAREIKEKIENEMQYPGTIKVTVIRETRVTEEAR